MIYLENLKERVQSWKKNRPRTKKYTVSNRYRLGFLGALLLFFAILGTVAHANKNNVQIDDSGINRYITSSSSIENTHTDYNPRRRAVVSHFYVGNLKNVDDVDDVSNLQNIKYEVSAVSKSDPKKKLPSRVLKVNDNYFVVITKVPSNFGVLKLIITPRKINRHLETDLTNYADPKFYIYESKTKVQPYLIVGNLSTYQVNYEQFLAKNYRHKIKINLEKVKTAQATIAADNASINKLMEKKESAVDEEADDLQRQIDTRKDDIKTQNLKISDAKKEIQKYRDRLISKTNQ